MLLYLCFKYLHDCAKSKSELEQEKINIEKKYPQKYSFERLDINKKIIDLDKLEKMSKIKSSDFLSPKSFSLFAIIS